MAHLALPVAATVFGIGGKRAQGRAERKVERQANEAAAAAPTEPVMPDEELLKRQRQRSIASRLQTGRASTILSQPSGDRLGP